VHAANTIVVATLLLAVDNLDWPTVERTLAPEVVADYTLLWGGEPERLPSTELVSRWQRLLPGFDATQHLIGPVVVGGGAQRHLRHRGPRLPPDIVNPTGAATWTVAGQYVVDLERHGDAWRISGITLRLAYEEGDRALAEVAMKRVAAGSGGRVAAQPNRT